MIIFNEKKYAEELLEKGFIDYISWSDLLILAKYFRSLGQNNSQIKKSIVVFYEEFSHYNEKIVGEKVDNAIKKSKKYCLRISTSVEITKKEVESIRSIKNYKLEKICFIMLVLSRANKIAYNSSSSRYYLSMNFAEILEMASVRSDKNGRKNLKYKLNNMNMISAPEVNRNALFNRREMHEILFAYENSSCEITVIDLNNIISFYPQKCILCGKEMPDIKKGKRSNLCDKCYAKERREAIKISVRKNRKK